MFKKGQLLILEQGAYSAFGYAGPFTVVQDFEREMAVTKFMAETAEQDRDEGHFIAWLARSGYIEDVPSEVWYLGEYGFEPLDWVTEDSDWNADAANTLKHRSYERTPEAEARHEDAERAYREEQAARRLANPGLAAYSTSTMQIVRIGGGNPD